MEYSRMPLRYWERLGLRPEYPSNGDVEIHRHDGTFLVIPAEKANHPDAEPLLDAWLTDKEKALFELMEG